jgi:hypothetical protein
MNHLGEFGKARPPLSSTFGYFGTTLRTNPELSDIAVIDLFTSLEKMEGSDVIVALRGLASTLVHPDDAGEFWRLVKANRQNIDDLTELAMALIAAATGRPTKLPADSSDGQPTTAKSSTADSSSPALQLLDGRPDLQVAVLRARKAHAS